MEVKKYHLNPNFTETVIEGLREDINKHLALVLSWWYEFIPDLEDELTISEEWICYTDLEWQRLSTPQLVIILLEVSDFLFRNSEVPNLEQIKRKIVLLPNLYNRIIEEWITNGDLFRQVTISHWAYCLSKAFLLLRAKLFERQTWLYHALFLKAILMLDREQIPPQFLLWNEFSGLSWLSFVRRYLVSDDNVAKWISIDIEWLSDYPNLWKEIEELYYNSFISWMSTNMLLSSIKSE